MLLESRIPSCKPTQAYTHIKLTIHRKTTPSYTQPGYSTNEVQSTRNFMGSTFLGKYHKLDSWDYGNTFLTGVEY